MPAALGDEFCLARRSQRLKCEMSRKWRKRCIRCVRVTAQRLPGGALTRSPVSQRELSILIQHLAPITVRELQTSTPRASRPGQFEQRRVGLLGKRRVPTVTRCRGRRLNVVSQVSLDKAPGVFGYLPTARIDRYFEVVGNAPEFA